MTEYLEGSVVNGTQSLVTMNEKDERKSERTFNLYIYLRIGVNWSIQRIRLKALQSQRVSAEYVEYLLAKF